MVDEYVEGQSECFSFGGRNWSSEDVFLYRWRPGRPGVEWVELVLTTKFTDFEEKGDVKVKLILGKGANRIEAKRRV